MPINDDLLGIYLNDHLAGATVGRELCKRAAGNNRGTEYGAFLDELCEEIVEDRDALKGVMDRLDVGEDVLKTIVALIAERAGRFKLNGSVLSYSPLSRLVELEGLALGVTGKLKMWRVLQELEDPRLDGVDLPALELRAERQQAEIEERRLDAAADAFLTG